MPNVRTHVCVRLPRRYGEQVAKHVIFLGCLDGVTVWLPRVQHRLGDQRAQQQRLAAERRNPTDDTIRPFWQSEDGFVTCGVPHEDNNDIEMRPQVIPFGTVLCIENFFQRRLRARLLCLCITQKKGRIKRTVTPNLNILRPDSWTRYMLCESTRYGGTGFNLEDAAKASNVADGASRNMTELEEALA